MSVYARAVVDVQTSRSEPPEPVTISWKNCLADLQILEICIWQVFSSEQSASRPSQNVAACMSCNSVGCRRVMHGVSGLGKNYVQVRLNQES